MAFSEFQLNPLNSFGDENAYEETDELLISCHTHGTV
jgi:hypothetical protein